MTREIEKLKKFKEMELAFKDKLDYYEKVIEELTHTNTELMVEHTKFNQIIAEKVELTK